MGGPITRPSTSQGASGAAERLQARMDAIVARVRDGQEPTRDLTEPRRSPEPVAPPTDAEAEANLMAGFKDALAWERTYDKHTDFDGEPVWIDRATGEVHKALPQLHPKDGGIL